MSELHYYIRLQGKNFGPYAEAELLSHVRGGRVPFSAWVFDGGGWRLLAENSKWREAHPEFAPAPAENPAIATTAAATESLELVAQKTKSAGGVAASVSAEPVWFVIREKKKFGPYSSADLVQQLQKKQLEGGAFVWRPGFETWRRLSDVAEFSRDSMKTLAAKSDEVDILVKRKFKRAPYEVEVVAHDNTRAIEGKTMVIGEGGLFLSTARPLHAVGARLKLHFREGGTPSFNAIAEVVSVVRGAVPGYCMRFVAISDSDRRRISTLVKESAR